MGLSVIIPTHNRKKNLLHLVSLLSGISTGFDKEIIVVNDVSDDGLSAELPRHVIYLQNTKGGVAASRNLGAAKAAYEFLLFVDDDMLINEESIVRAHDFLVNNPGSVLNVDWIYPPELTASCMNSKFGRFLVQNGQTSLSGWMNAGEWKPQSLLKTNSLASPFLAIRKADFERAGKYNELFPFSGFEDYDFSKRVLQCGIAIWLDTRITVYHNEEENTKQKNWLRRRFRNAYTRGIGVGALGLNEMKLHYTPGRKIAFGTIYSARPVYRFMLSCIPNSKAFDKLYGAAFRPLLGAYLITGYRRGLKAAENKRG